MMVVCKKIKVWRGEQRKRGRKEKKRSKQEENRDDGSVVDGSSSRE